MSIALLHSAVSFTGRLPIKAGSLKGKKIEPGAKLLADQLMLSHIFGRPEVIDPAKTKTLLTNKRGLIFFWKITGYDGGTLT
ncbi:hypothetical protein J0667_20135 [Methylomonas sp. WH-1]